MTEALYVARWWLDKNKNIPFSFQNDKELAKLIEIIYNLGKHDMLLNDVFVKHLFNQIRRE